MQANTLSSRRSLLAAATVGAVSMAGCSTFLGGSGDSDEGESFPRLQLIRVLNYDSEPHTLSLLVDLDTADTTVDHWANHEIPAGPEPGDPTTRIPFRAPDSGPSKFRVYGELDTGDSDWTDHHLHQTIVGKPVPENPCAYTKLSISSSGSLDMTNVQMEEENC